MTSKYCCVYECRECGRIAMGAVNSSEPPGWGYDDNESQYLCPDHSAGFRDEDDPESELS